MRTSALRFYEEAGILPPAPRVGGQRRYDTDLQKMIDVLGFAQRAGFTLAEIKELFQGSRGTGLGDRWKAVADAKIEQLDQLIAHATQMKGAIRRGIRCGCVRLDDCTVVAREDSSRSSTRKGNR